MAEITEKTLIFTFPDDWNAAKYDETAWHTDQMKNQLHAMDILASKDGLHWWIEVKDCKGFESDNLPRLSASEPEEVVTTQEWVKDQGWKALVKVDRKKLFIVDEIVEKFRHTLFALACAQRAGEPELAKHEVVRSDTPFTVMLK